MWSPWAGHRVSDEPQMKYTEVVCEGNHKGCPYGRAPFVLRTFPPRSGGNPAPRHSRGRGNPEGQGVGYTKIYRNCKTVKL